MITSQSMKRSSPLIRIWARIRDELAAHQDMAQDERCGAVVNPISGAVYSQNTACAALVFAAEYVQQGDQVWLSRADRAINSLNGEKVLMGVDEPKWNRLGWQNNRGSLFATGTLLDALWNAKCILRMETKEEGQALLLDYLKTCKIKSGQYSHDSIVKGHTSVPVQNVTAIALYILESIASRSPEPGGDIIEECRHVTDSLIRGQREDGFWPYTCPDPVQRLTFRFPAMRPIVKNIPLIRRYVIGVGDGSILFGDAVHHCLVLFYFAKCTGMHHQHSSFSKQSLKKGWNWIQEHLVEYEDGKVRFDFDWEPIPTGFRHANFRDTSTYFLILAMLPTLTRFDVVSEEDCRRICNGMLLHIESCLLQDTTFPTCIKPYEGPDEVLKWILPRVGEASAWKGALLAEYMLVQNSFSRV